MLFFANTTYSETLPTEVAEIATSISPELALTETVVLLVHAAYAPPTTSSATIATMMISFDFFIVVPSTLIS